MEKIAFWKNKLSLLDIFIEFLRFYRIKKYLQNLWEKIVVDCWSWYNCKLLKKINAKKKIWIDINFSDLWDDGIMRVNCNLENWIDLDSNSVDVVISLALIEHLNDYNLFVCEIYRILKKDGKLILTTPSKKSQWLLEFLAFKLHLISKEQILDHKNYFDKNDLIHILLLAWFKKENIQHTYFQFWYNNLIICTKN